MLRTSSLHAIRLIRSDLTGTGRVVQGVKRSQAATSFTIGTQRESVRESRQSCAARYFSSRSKSPRKKDENAPLSNEGLISFLRRKHGSAEVNVRVLERNKKPTLMPLMEAIQLSVANNVDMIGIAVATQDVPVIRLDSLNAFLYQQKIENRRRKTSTVVSKEFRFKSGIAEGDLERKRNQMMETLEAGNVCIVSFQCPRWKLAKGQPMLLRDTIESILEPFKDLTDWTLPKLRAGEDSRARITLQPRKRKIQQKVLGETEES